MSAQFLEAFVSRVLHDLVRSDRIEIKPDSHDKIVKEVAAVLGKSGTGSSLISTFVAALIENAHVEELYAENDEIKELIVDLGL